MAKFINIDKKWLKKKYLDEQLSLTTIASICHVYASTIHRKLRRYNIKVRNFKESVSLWHKKHPGKQIGRQVSSLTKQKMSVAKIGSVAQKYKTYDWLYNQYYNKNKSLIQMANEVGVAFSTIGYWMDNLNIERKLAIEIDKEWLEEQYVEYDLSSKEIGMICHVSPSTIIKLLKKHKIKVRNNREAHIGLTAGHNNPNFKGWASLEPYGQEFTSILKEQIRKRDHYQCQLCKSKIGYKDGRDLPVHHIDYNKRNNKAENLITLCNNCHMKTNYNRKYWQCYFSHQNKSQLPLDYYSQIQSNA